MKKRYKIGITFVAVAAIAVVVAVFVGGWALNSTVRIENASDRPVQQVKTTLSASQERWTENVGDLQPGQSKEFTWTKSDLFIQSLEYQFQGESRKWSEGGVATTTNTLVVKIHDDGAVTAETLK